MRGPQILDRALWERSGHWQNYKDNMFTTESEKNDYAIKPMNCPGHVQVFNQGVKSYRDLPYRLGEFGACHRNEPSGALHGIMRVRAFTQDDAHIFCTEDQLEAECLKINDLMLSIYGHFGSKDGLYLALAERASEQFAEYVNHAFQPEYSPLEQVLAAGDVYLRFHLEHPGSFRFLAFAGLETTQSPSDDDLRQRVELPELPSPRPPQEGAGRHRQEDIAEEQEAVGQCTHGNGFVRLPGWNRPSIRLSGPHR